MSRTVRIAYTNLVQASASVLVPSSEEAAFPRAALTRQIHTDVWRTKTGWTIVVNENNQIWFNRAATGDFVAVVAAGYYATGAALATAIVTALEAAEAAPVWACDYNVTAANKFTISSDLAFKLNWSTNAAGSAVPARRMYDDLGWTSADTAVAATQTAPNVSYQSRHVINVDVGSSQAHTVAIVRGHNVSASGTIRVDDDTSTLVGVGWTGGIGVGAEVLAGTDPRVLFFTSNTRRYLRLVIIDGQNSVGYAEVGIWFTGTYASPTTPESVEKTKVYGQFSEKYLSIGGVNHVSRRNRQPQYILKWKTNSSADVAIFEALDLAMPTGTDFFISFDATDAPTTSTVYGYLEEGIRWEQNDGALYVLPVQFFEALG